MGHTRYRERRKAEKVGHPATMGQFLNLNISNQTALNLISQEYQSHGSVRGCTTRFFSSVGPYRTHETGSNVPSAGRSSR